MKSIGEKIKSFIYYQISEKHPATEYVVGATESFEETKAIIDMCPQTFSPLEMVRLFAFRYARIAISIALTGLLWAFYGEQLARELFYAFTMPNWMLPFCLFGASEISTRVLNEVLFGR